MGQSWCGTVDNTEDKKFKEYFRGRKIEKAEGEYIYSDTGESVSENYKTRTCGYCDKHYTKEGHDGCLGTLPNVMNACCGHGRKEDAYVQFNKEQIFRGARALFYFNLINQ